MKAVNYKLILLFTAICSILAISNKYNLRAKESNKYLTCKITNKKI
jgi:hypothetical protein